MHVLFQDLNTLFDKRSDTLVISKSPDNNAGPSVSFYKSILLKDVQIQTRHNTGSERYKNMCLYADNTIVACTPDDFEIGLGDWVRFKVTFKYSWSNFQFFGAYQSLISTFVNKQHKNVNAGIKLRNNPRNLNNQNCKLNLYATANVKKYWVPMMFQTALNKTCSWLQKCFCLYKLSSKN
jgi:hypothetical protein